MAAKQAEPSETIVQGSNIRVDFGGTSGTGVVDKGVYQVKVISAVVGTSNSSGKPKVTFTLEILDGNFKGRRLFLNHSLQSHALFGFRKTLEALGVKVPTGAMDIDVRKLAGAMMNVQVDHEEYNGQIKPKVVDQAPIHYDESAPLGGEDDDKQVTKSAADPTDPENDI